jgi:hypothetical protein
MGDDGPDIEPCLEEASQSIPGAEETTTGDPVDADPLENHFVR